MKNFKNCIFLLLLLLVSCASAVLAACVTNNVVFYVSYQADDNGYIDGLTYQTVTQGENCEVVTAVPNEGYKFVKWSDGITTETRTETNVNSDITVTAIFEKLSFYVIYETDGNGTILGEANQTVAYGENGTEVKAIPNKGYKFVKWSDGITTETRSETNVNSNITVTAIFEKLLCTVKYYLTWNGTIEGETSQIVTYGGSCAPVKAIPAEGYRFVKWSDGCAEPERTDTNIITDINLTAIFEKLTYRVVYETDGNGTIEGEENQIVAYGENSAVVTARPNIGYIFVKWSDGNMQPERQETNIKANVTLTAIFEKQFFTVKYTTYGNGTIEGQINQKIFNGENGTTVTAVADDGYEFVGWSDGKIEESRTESNVKKNINIIAYFEISIFFTYEYMCNSGGRLEGEAIQTVRKNEMTSVITAIPEDGYVFDGWMDGLKTSTRQDKGGWYGDKTFEGNSIQISCYFRKIVTVNYYVKNGIGGHISGESEQQIFARGDATAVTAVPNEGYMFVGWSDGETKNIRQDTYLTKNFTMTAYFEPFEKVFKYDYMGGTENTDKKTVTVSRDNPKASTFVIPQKDGYEFCGWYADKNFTLRVTDADGELMLGYNTVTLNTDTLYARWSSSSDNPVVFKILVVIVDEIDATLKTRENGAYKHVKYKISMVERKLCEQVAGRISDYLNSWFEGKVKFEVDTYFTTIPVGEEGFKNSGDWIRACYIVELQNLISKYDSFLVLFDMNDIDNEIKEPGVSGLAIRIEGSAYLERFMQLTERCAITMDEILNDYDKASAYYWGTPISTCIHELIHTIADRYRYEDLYYYHAVIDYYRESIPTWSKWTALEISRLYLLCEAEIDGEMVGIPPTFWSEGKWKDGNIYVSNN